MSWEGVPPKVYIVVAGEKHDVSNLTPQEIVQRIRELAAQKGLRVFDVYVNGRLALPETFEEILEEEKRRSVEVKILIVKRDIAG